jgi:hypothetical protein
MTASSTGAGGWRKLGGHAPGVAGGFAQAELHFGDPPSDQTLHRRVYRCTDSGTPSGLTAGTRPDWSGYEQGDVDPLTQDWHNPSRRAFCREPSTE